MSYQTSQSELQAHNAAVEAENRRNKVALDNAARRLLLLIKQENRLGGKESAVRERFLMRTQDVLDVMHVRLSMRSLYRRYRGIYINALSDALAIIAEETTKDGAKRAIIDKLVEIGTAEKNTKKANKE